MSESERDRPLWAPLSNGQLAALLLLAHGLLWTLLPTALNRNLPLDVVEALAWGREWQWGYYKHPPLSGWMADLMRFGPHDASLYLLSQLMVSGALWANWLLGRELLGSRLATLGLMAMSGIHYVSYSGVEFNANVVLFPLWAWGSLCGWQALQRGGLGWWLALGLCSGLGTLGKYAFMLLPGSLFLYALIQPTARHHWRTAGPWLAMLVFGAVVSPHVQWAVQLDWPTLHYAVGRGHSDELAQSGDWAGEFASFVVTQVITLLPAWLLLRSLGPAQASTRPASQRWLLFTLAIGPLLLIMSAATVAQAKLVHMWASPFFLCITPLYLAWRTPSAQGLRRFAVGCAACVLLFASLYAGIGLWAPQVKHKLDRTSYPGRDVTQALSAQWHQQTGQPLRIVAGEEFVAGSIAHASAEHPSVFYDADFRESLWLTPEQVEREGALFVWPIGRGDVPVSDLPADSSAQVAPLLTRYPQLKVQPVLKVQTTWMGKPYTVAVAWAVLPPANRSPMPVH